MFLLTVQKENVIFYTTSDQSDAGCQGDISCCCCD